jgi:hypothetical protein
MNSFIIQNVSSSSSPSRARLCAHPGNNSVSRLLFFFVGIIV